ncbi:hypothetical protein CQ052_15480 [Ochrobactrum sp. MYb15]|nr:hypothetical protein CQZ90_08605 [Ochrobactrum sp. MYb19]PRA68675.1 hypothetical protein CQ053_03600 [Ochrobactrum sp. MYb18]PRA74098.1 hypothetical protein CQ049_12485 [Brucella thiophenivorans]PRA90927.1 hypothetical protein CQ051_13505 [Ochrobactrum sp. MYb14]PRA96377.1 hypothetical protein CQ052_15480 [Ochrobactrum sp. MYb15]
MVLYVVTVSYVAFCCLILGWLVATEDTVIEALVVMGGTYGTLLAGIPVIIAVLVAKQQLDAMRRQHVATVKRSFRDELEAIRIATEFCQAVLQTRTEDILDQGSINIVLRDKKLIESTFDAKTSGFLSSAQSMINSATSSLDHFKTDREGYCRHAHTEARKALIAIECFEKKISQYWS